MTLSAGTRLGPYEIIAPIGAGGMGEVYKARDTRLERTVAVKVLPPHLSSSAELRERFEREAKTISQISHPHICALYDVNREGETEYLVMEFLEGETLADRLGKGSLSAEHLLRYGAEIADALDKAHRQGIVHRDLKPGNVMLTKSGVKLLDFGLAFQRPLDAAGRERTAAEHDPMVVNSLTAIPTVVGSPNLTEQGTILGTFQYMSPEQLEGRPADARSDIFAFGAVLYEMATGKKAFSGTSQASLIGSILRDDPAPPRSSTRETPLFRRTANGSLTCRTNRDGRRSTSSRFRGLARSSRSLRAAPWAAGSRRGKWKSSMGRSRTTSSPSTSRRARRESRSARRRSSSRGRRSPPSPSRATPGGFSSRPCRRQRPPRASRS